MYIYWVLWTLRAMPHPMVRFLKLDLTGYHQLLTRNSLDYPETALIFVKATPENKHAQMHTCTHTCTHACIHTYLYTYMNAYLSVHYSYTYIYICIYTLIEICRERDTHRHKHVRRECCWFRRAVSQSEMRNHSTSCSSRGLQRG